MPITHATPPAPSLDVLTGHVAPLYLGSDEVLDMPHRIFDVDAADLQAGRGLDAATLTGWRYISRAETGEHRVVEIGVDESTGTHRFHFVNTGDHVDNFVALHDDGPATALDRDYELSVLRAPGCLILAMWLTAPDGGHEFLVPLAPAHSNVVAGVPYEPAEFAAILQTTAREMAGSSPGRPGTDDLTLVEGIGPQIAEFLRGQGVTSFAELAARTPDELRALLRHGGTRFNRADPTTWPQQAALAAAARWDELDDLQERLTGGR